MVKVFISHATEDKLNIARPLAELLVNNGFDVWYDEYSLTLGDNLRKSIDDGLLECDFGIVILSPNFFKKEWTQIELEGLFSKEIDNGKTILPVWHNIDRKTIKEYSSILSNKIGVNSSEGIDKILSEITKAIQKKRATISNVKRQDNPSDYFVFLKFMVEGKNFEKILRSLWINRAGISESEISTFEVNSFQEFRMLGANVVLKDGTFIKVNERQIKDAVNFCIPEALKSYKVLYWDVDFVAKEGESFIDIKECMLNFIIYRETGAIEKNSYQKLMEIIDFFEENQSDVYNYFLDYSFLFTTDSYSTLLLKNLINSKDYTLISKLIFDNLHLSSGRLSFEVSDCFLGQTIKKGISLSEEDLNLIKKIYSNETILSKYWQERIEKEILNI